MSMRTGEVAFVHVVSKDGTKVTMTYEDVRLAVLEWEKQAGRAARVGDAIALCDIPAGARIVVDSFDMANATVSVGIKKQ